MIENRKIDRERQEHASFGEKTSFFKFFDETRSLISIDYDSSVVTPVELFTNPRGRSFLSSFSRDIEDGKIRDDHRGR